MDLPLRIEPRPAIAPKRDSNRRGGKPGSGARFSLAGAPPPAEHEADPQQSERLVAPAGDDEDVGTRIDVVG